MEVQYATNGKANAALTTGIIGTVGTGLALLSGMGGLFNNGCYNGYNNGCCSDNTLVTRYELDKEGEIAKLRSEKDSLLISQATDKKILELYQFFDGRLNRTGEKIADLAGNQAVINQKINDNLAFIDHKIDDVSKDLKCYVDANFVPGKLVMPLDAICPAAMPVCPEK